MNNGRMLQILCILLQDDVFQLPAAECLLQIVNRKGSVSKHKCCGCYVNQQPKKDSVWSERAVIKRGSDLSDLEVSCLSILIT